ncbi:MAG: hypothetical protein U0930_03385 [Pirellulales bacterium]
MDHIQQKSAMARRRMIVERFLSFVPLTFGSLFLVALVGAMLPKMMTIEVDPQLWLSVWFGSAAVLALIVNSVMTLIGRPTVVDAATELDRRFKLRERLSSTLLLAPEDRETELGQALAADANRRAEGLDIGSNFSWGFNRRMLIPILPLLLAGLYFVIPDRTVDTTADKKAQTVSPNLVKNTTQPLLEQIKRKREAAEKEGLKDAAEMLKKLEGDLEKMQADSKLDPKEALSKLNDIKEQLNERRKELGSSEALKKNLMNMDKFEEGPAEELAEAMKKGDFDKAEKALEQLMKDMKAGKLDKSDMEKLEKQLEQLKKSLEQSSQAHDQAKKNLQEQIKQAQKSGDSQKAGELQRKLEQMQAMDSSMAQMQEMSEMLSKCQNCMKSGDQQGMQEAMQEMANQLSEMNMSDAELQDLDQLMDKLSQCKNGMNEGMGQGKMMSEFPGRGMGEGQGEGERPEEENEVDFFQSQVRDQVKKGEMKFGGKIGGENRKGVSRVQVQEEIAKDLASEPEPLDDTPMSKTQREHTRNYYNTLRDGKK